VQENAAWRAATRIMAGVEDLVQMTRDGHTGQVLGGREIERSGGAMCGLYRARGDEKREFLY
jgi:plasmid stabilization system protein ParE